LRRDRHDAKTTKTAAKTAKTVKTPGDTAEHVDLFGRQRALLIGQRFCDGAHSKARFGQPKCARVLNIATRMTQGRNGPGAALRSRSEGEA
jgi:hypothetical protein